MPNKRGLFDFCPDMDFDGDRDLQDMLFFEDILEEEEKITSKRSAMTPERFHVKRTDEEDVFFEYGIDPDDYIIREEYEDAVFEAKYGWRDDVEAGCDYDLDPNDFETEDEYNNALEQAVFEAENPENNEQESELIIPIKIVWGGSLDSQNEDEEITYKTGIEFRKNQAREYLRFVESAKWYDDKEKINRCKFIVEDSCVAARYLSTNGIYLYAQAVRDYFKLPFDIPEEWDTVKVDFGTLLRDLVEDDALYAIDVWEWCLDTFMPYIQYGEYKNDLTHAILIDMSNFVEEFPGNIVEHMMKNPSFIEKLVLQCTDTLWCIEDFVTIALEGRHIEIAKRVMKCAFINEHNSIYDKVRFIESCIEECSNWNEVETIKLFQEHVFPIVFSETDVRIKNKIPRWEQEIQDYIASVEDH